MRVLGLDPGSLRTGYGVVEDNEEGYFAVALGTLTQKGALQDRLKGIYEGLNYIIRQYAPEVIACEMPFVAKNAKSALRLGQVQGVILLCASHYQLPYYEYSPQEVKMSLTGYGRAPKEQVRDMVQRILRLKEAPPLDASDALAVAICFLHCNGKGI